jgi:flagellar hook-associated protein 2
MVQRITGLATGIDTESIIKQLVTAARMPVDKLVQQRMQIQWQRQDYLDMNTKLYDFRNNKLFNFKLEGTLAAKKVDISGNTDAVSARAMGNAQLGTMTVKVIQLATASQNVGTGAITADPTFDPNKPLSTEGTKLDPTFDPSSNFSFTINGTTLTFNPATASLNTVISEINKKTNVTAFYDTSTKQISLVSKQAGLTNGPSGDGDKITLSSGDFLEKSLKLLNANSTAAQEAKVEINGLTVTRPSNVFTVNGVELTLKSVSPNTNPADLTTYTPSTLTIKTDTDKIVDAIKGFINDYNDMLKTMQDKISEPRYRDYLPLTDEQKKEMKDEDIQAWEEKAKSGLLRNDSILSEAVSSMRLAISAQVANGSKYNTLSSIGITTGGYQEKGKLYLSDEAKLRQAIEEDPQAVVDLFTANGNGDSDQSDVGIAERIYSALDSAMKNISKKAGTSAILNDDSVLGKQMYYLGKQIDDGNERVKQIEDRYYRQFAAMEEAINRMNAQSAQLLSAFGGGK